jgi:hypothetical protein
MAAPKGNQFWKVRSSHGRNPIFSKPDDLWNVCCEYFEWVEANPLWEDKVMSYQGVNTHEPIAKMRAMTISGLCTFLDITRTTWDEYRKREDFTDIISRVEAIIRDQKFAGAAADLLNANIIARDLGLSEKQELTGKMEVTESDPRQLSRAILAVLGEAALEDDTPGE